MGRSGKQNSARTRQRVVLLMMLIGALSLMMPSLAGATSTAADSSALAAADSSNISITQVDSPDQGWFCLPGALILQRYIHNTPEYFELEVIATSRPCEPIYAKAAIYGMPGDGVAWPQNLVEVADFTISKAGTTKIRFTKTCDPVQFDVLTGDTPQTISPLGPWHGPLLFPFDMETSYQHWGCGGEGTTTTTSPCENYSARQIAVNPTVVEPGGTVTVSGLGTPGSTISVWVSPSEGDNPGAGGPPVTVTVPESGEWSTDFTIDEEAPLGSWTANAESSDCEGVMTAMFTVQNQDEGPGDPGDENGSTTSSTTPSVGPIDQDPDEGVLGDNADNPLPDSAVLNASTERDGAAQNGNQESALAWTGSTIRNPIIIGVALLAAGVLLLLRSRRTADAA